MCFAVERNEDKFQPVETVDSKAAGITIKMYDYDANYQKNIMGGYNYTAGGGATSLVTNALSPEGFPVLKNGTSLEPLFTSNNTFPEREANHLFIKSTYDETGYFEYSWATPMSMILLSIRNWQHLTIIPPLITDAVISSLLIRWIQMIILQ